MLQVEEFATFRNECAQDSHNTLEYISKSACISAKGMQNALNDCTHANTINAMHKRMNQAVRKNTLCVAHVAGYRDRAWVIPGDHVGYQLHFSRRSFKAQIVTPAYCVSYPSHVSRRYISKYFHTMGTSQSPQIPIGNEEKFINGLKEFDGQAVYDAVKPVLDEMNDNFVDDMNELAVERYGDTFGTMLSDNGQIQFTRCQE